MWCIKKKIKIKIGRALECIGYIGEAVGAEQFADVAKQLMPFTIGYIG